MLALPGGRGRRGDADLGGRRAVAAVEGFLGAPREGGRVGDDARRQFEGDVLDVRRRADVAAVEEFFGVGVWLTAKLLTSSKGRAPAPVDGRLVLADARGDEGRDFEVAAPGAAPSWKQPTQTRRDGQRQDQARARVRPSAITCHPPASRRGFEFQREVGPRGRAGAGAEEDFRLGPEDALAGAASSSAEDLRVERQGHRAGAGDLFLDRLQALAGDRDLTGARARRPAAAPSTP